ncbi:related to dehydrogenase/reductase [Rhynchosporium secalis]|uniref:Related to dehydrogenase/reductase n=1 Tax=Rhynchosporium secalis TaxID=38038 RepID=A0A1E1MLE8_RHYSE|nr:related to dehydrogenase/reductase [Rhynchosporium secalis]
MSLTATIIITGGTSGLGYNAALILARQNPTYLIIVASRKDSDTSATSINKTLKQKNAIFLPVDLSKLESIRAFASSFSKNNYPPIKALLLNAALQFPAGLYMTEDGIEKTFGITHVGNALLYHLLTPHLADNARIVVTSSGTHDPAQKSGLPDAVYISAEMLAHPTGEWATMKDGLQRYASAKLTNVLWTYALHRRLEKSTSAANAQKESNKKITITAMDPGLMPGTSLARDWKIFNYIPGFFWFSILPLLTPLARRFVHPNIHTAKESGAALANLATAVEFEGTSGKYFEGNKEIKSSVDSYNIAFQEDLWEWTVKNVSLNEEERARFDLER